MANIELIVGLGNPGKDYASTRHNAGAWWVEALCQQQYITLQQQTKLKAHIGQGQIDGNSFRCAIPTTYMNHSGQSVGAIAKYFNISPEAILIVHDELDLEPGTARFKQGGGHAGHNGLRDIIPQLGSPNFHRLRIGIGHPGHKNQVANYVLHTPSKPEKDAISTAIDSSLLLTPKILQCEWDAVKQQAHSL